MSLWTPGGEVPVERTPSDPATSNPEQPPAGERPDLRQVAASAGIDLDSLSPDERERAEMAIMEMLRAQQEVAAAPAEAVVANHAGGLYELAAIKLGMQPPELEDARLAIDALGGLLEATGDRLGEPAVQLGDLVNQLRAAWVELSKAADEAGTDEP